MSDVEQAKNLYFEALAFIDVSDFQSAELRLREALPFSPGSLSILTNLSIVLLHQGKRTEARAYAEKALAAKADNIEALLVLAECNVKEEKFAEALSIYKNITAINPGIIEAHHNVGMILEKSRNFIDALARYDRAIALEPDLADAHCSRGNVLVSLARYDEAFSAYDKALALKPDFADAWHGRGNVYCRLNRYDEALAAYRSALALKPDCAEAWHGCGNVFSVLQRHDDARAAYRHALTHKPELFESLNALALLLLAEGNIVEAFGLARRALAANETPETKLLAVSCLRSPLLHPGMDDLRDLLLRALTEPWARPFDLAATCNRFLVLNGAIRDSMARAAKAWPKLLPFEALAGSSSLAQIADDRLLRALLETTPVCDVALERFATGLRCSLVTAARSTADSAVAEPVLGLYCALARQCFINSYVFAQSDAEIEQVRALRDALVAALGSGAAISDLSLVAVAAYVPLHSLPGAGSLLDRPWPDAVNALLEQQVRAPIEEHQLRSSIPALTAIDDGVSIQVRDQYEENPYPQWVKAPPVGESKAIDVLMREKFPLSLFVETGRSGDIDVMVAGCGTGQHSVDTARRFSAAQILAIDLSLSSLCYAQRQTRALGLQNIQYAQADIMKLSALGRAFDVIESVGVLHHLADPFAGWRVLLSILRPGGLMRLGFYSEIARRGIVTARNFIASRGYRPTADDIRQCRQDIYDHADGTPLKNVTGFGDFFSLNDCRDLLFHIQEHRMTIPQIAGFIAESNLQFLGFEIDPQIRRNYAHRFPADVAMTDLAQWHRFETDNPDSFVGMYQFWVQKK